MKHILIAALLCFTVLPVQAEEPERKPEDLTMHLAWIADAGTSTQFIFVINGVLAYETVDGLKDSLKGRPKGSTLTWDPGCVRFGGEPLLGSEAEMKKFKSFCETNGITLVLVPSG